MASIKEKQLENATANGYGGSAPQRKVNFVYSIGERVPARVVLYFLSWSGFLVSFMMRMDINFALLAMVNKTNITAGTIRGVSGATPSVGIGGNSSYIGITTTMETPSVAASTFGRDCDAMTSNNYEQFEQGGEFEWSSTIEASILGSFYWFYVISQVVGGIATQYFGTKNVFGWSQFATAAGSLCIPYAAQFHYGAVIAIRSIQGFASGLTWPAMYAVVGHWIPPAERSRFMSSFQGFSIGIGLTYMMCGFIINHAGWPYVFYTTGTLGMAWCVLWYLLAFNTPSQHPRISKQELEYIERNVSSEIKDGLGMRVPWTDILSSLPAWSIGVTTFGRIWVHYQFIMSGPKYMQRILCFKYQSNGMLSGLPFICSYISSTFFCWIADILATKRIMTLTNIRKLFTAASQILPGIMIFAIGYIDDNVVLVLTIWFLAVTLITASYAGAMASIVDIAPNLAGPVLAFAQTIHMSASFLSPVVTGFMLTDEKSILQWREVFGLSSAIAICTYLMFQMYGTADIQPWNYPPKKSRSSEESEMLRSSVDNENERDAKEEEE